MRPATEDAVKPVRLDQAALTRKQHEIAVMRAHGIVYPIAAWEEAHRVGLALAYACAMLDQETGGGRNVFGHDPTICIGWGNVNRIKYGWYKARRRASGNRLMQGVGPTQLTWWSTQDEADAEGGCWQPRYNMRVGFRHLAFNIRRYGIYFGVKAYNGSGPAADQYARAVIDRAHLWQQRLA